jgi:nucleotidyltransferase/DNA polymerase involved in DNA repair
MRQRIIALVDCDCFFVSCERKDNPALAGKPVCVMTGGGNRGIIVSRAKEAKALGIKMGAPYFQIKDVYRQAVCIPARMQRYAEISAEVMNVVKSFSPDVEVTSIDEAYIDLTGLAKAWHTTYTDIVKNIRQTVWDKVQIPVSIGLSCSKILAKLASDRAKNTGGVFVIRPDRILETIGDISINDVCGVGRKNNVHMQYSGIFTVRDFVEKDNAWIRQAFGINGLSLKQELSGIATSLVESKQAAPQSIQDTQSFEDFTTSLELMQHALSEHVHTACRKLRQWNGFCAGIEVILKNKDFTCSALEAKLPTATNSDFDIRAAAQQLLKKLYRPNVLYRATGITLKNLSYGDEIQQSLFEEVKRKDDKLSHVIDALEAKFGPDTVKSGGDSVENVNALRKNAD